MMLKSELPEGKEITGSDQQDHVMATVENGPTPAEISNSPETGTKIDSLADLKVNFYCNCCNQQFYKRADFDNHKSASGHNKCVNQPKTGQGCFKTEVKTRKELRELEKEKAKFLNSGGSLSSPVKKVPKLPVKQEIVGKVIQNVNDVEDSKDKEVKNEKGKELARKRLKAFSQTPSTSAKTQGDTTCQKSSQIMFTLNKKSVKRISQTNSDDQLPSKESKIKSVVVKPSEQKIHIVRKSKDFLETGDNAKVIEDTCNSELQSDNKITQGKVADALDLSPGTIQCESKAQNNPVEKSDNEQKDGTKENHQGSSGNKQENTNKNAATNSSSAVNSSDCSGDNTLTNSGSGDGEENEDKDKKTTSAQGPDSRNIENADEDPNGKEKSNTGNEESNDVEKEWKPSFKDGFLQVLNKDESRILQWPLDMVSYTKTEPSICYSCNPLHFEFRKPVKKESIEDDTGNKDDVGNSNQIKNPVTLLVPRQIMTKTTTQENNVASQEAVPMEISVEKKHKKSKKKKKRSKKGNHDGDGEKTKRKSKKKGSRKRKRDKSKDSKSGDKDSSKRSHHSGDNYTDEYSDDEHYGKRRSKSSSKDKNRKRHHSFSSDDRSSDDEYRDKKPRLSSSRKDDDDYENSSHRSRTSRDRSRRYSSDSDSDRSRSRSRRSRRHSRSRSYSRSYSRSRSRSRSRSHSPSPRRSSRGSSKSGGNKEFREALKEQARANAAGKTVPLKEKKGGITAAGIQQQIAAGGHTIPTTTTIISDMDTKRDSTSGGKQTSGDAKNTISNSDSNENNLDNTDKNFEDLHQSEGLTEEEIQRRRESFKRPGAPAPKAKKPVGHPHSVAAALYNIQNPEEICHELPVGSSTSSETGSSEEQSEASNEVESASTIQEMIPPEDIEKYRRLQEQARLHVQQKMIASGEIPPPPPPEAVTIERETISPSQQPVILQNHPHLIRLSQDGEVLHQAIGSPLLSQTLPGFLPHTPSPPPSSQQLLPAGVVPSALTLRGLQPGAIPVGATGIPFSALQAGAVHAGAFPAGAFPAGAFPAGAIPAGAIPAGAIPAGAIPAGAIPAGALHAGMLPVGAIPAGAIQGSVPTSAIQAGAIPFGALPAGAVPAGAIANGSLPPGAIPLGVIPQGALPAGAVHASALQRQGVPRLALPPGAVVVSGMAPGIHLPLEAMTAPRIVQANTLPRGVVPASALQKGVVKTGTLPRGVVPVSSLPRGALPSVSLPQGIINSSALPQGLIPARAIQTGGIRPGNIPTRAVATSAVPRGIVPAGALPRGVLPTGGLPPGAIPIEALQRQLPGGMHMPMGSQLRMIVPGRPGLVPAAQGRFPGLTPQFAVRQLQPGIPRHPGFQFQPGIPQNQRFMVPQQQEGQVRMPNLVGKPLIKTAPPKKDGD